MSDVNSEMTRLYELSARQGKRIAELEAKVQELEAENSLLKQQREEAWSISNGMPSYAQLTEKFGEIKVKLLEIEAENMKLRYAWFRSADYATRSLSDLPTPPEVEHLELLEQGEQ